MFGKLMKRVLICSALLLFATALAVSQDAPPPVERQSVGELYIRISGLSMPERRKVYRELDGKMKAKLWLLHITLFEIDHDNSFSAEQAEFIQRLKEILKGADMDAERETLLARLVGQQERAVALFGHDGASLLLSALGSTR